MDTRTFAATAAAAMMLGACSSLPDVPINPRPIHPDESVKLPPAPTPEAPLNAYEIPQQRYLRALADAANSTSPTTGQLTAYADAGITLVQVQCLRWFYTLGNRQQVKDFKDSNYNVIRQLGTALLGIGGASSVLVATYGAGNTAYEGISNNFEAAFLGAPNGKKVKQQIMGLLEQQAGKVTTAASAPSASLVAVYLQLEKYGDICTHATAREIVATALDQSTAKINDDGVLEVRPNAAALKLMVPPPVAAASSPSR